MPWKETTKMSLEREFVMLASREGANMSVLCRRFEISRKTGYKWLGRFREEGPGGLEERSRRPNSSPNKTPEHLAEVVCEVRREHPAWGGRKIRAVLRREADEGLRTFDMEAVPAASTCQAIVKRNGLSRDEEAQRHTPFRRFEKEAPNELWQMDFKGHFPLTGGGRCHTLTVVDDHSRFALCLEACPDEHRETVEERLTGVFRRYGLPRRLLCDNSLPWGVPTAERCGRKLYTRLNVWLFRLGIDVTHGRPYHPQTQGKNECFHRSFEAEALAGRSYQDLPECQQRFDPWRSVYNFERPHEALDLEVPANRYRLSGRCLSGRDFPEQLPPLRYGPTDEVRTVAASGTVGFQGERYYVGNAFVGEAVAVRPAESGPAESGPKTETWAVYYGPRKVCDIDLNNHDR